MATKKNIAFCVYGSVGTEMYYNTVREFDNTNMKFAVTREDDWSMYVNAVNQLSQRRNIRFATLEKGDIDNLAALCRQYKINYLFMYDWPENIILKDYDKYFSDTNIMQDDFTIVRIGRGYPPDTYGIHSHIDAIKFGYKYGVNITLQSNSQSVDVIHSKEMKIKPNETGWSVLKRSSVWAINFIHEYYESIVSKNSKNHKIERTIITNNLEKYFDVSSPTRIKLDKPYRAGDLIALLRAETFDKTESCSYFEYEGKTYKIKLDIEEYENLNNTTK